MCMYYCVRNLKNGIILKVFKHLVATPKFFFLNKLLYFGVTDFLFRCYDFPPLNVGDQTCDEIKGKELQVRN